MKKRSRTEDRNYTREALSIIFVGLGIILILAIVSYDRTDNPNLEILNNSIGIRNWLGPLGAALADPLMNFTLGYPILVLPVLIIFCAVQVYRSISLQVYIRPLVILVIWSIMLSILLAMPEAFETTGHIREYYPSGLVGGLIAENLILYLGKFGSILILAIALTALSVLSLRLDLKTITGFFSDLVNQLSAAVEQSYRLWQRERLERRRQRIKAREIRKQEARIETATRPPAAPEPAPETFRPRTPKTIETEGTVTKPQPPPSIHTTLDAILQHTDGTGIDTTIIKRAGTAGQAEPVQQEAEAVGFEVREEAKIEEVDYDRLVRESVAKYQYPSVDLLKDQPTEDTTVTHDELKANAALLESKLLDFGLEAKVIRVTAGPVITLYELQPAPGVKVSQIVSLANDLALAMEARGIRMVAPIPGKAAIGIEIPNRKPHTVYLKPLIRSETYAQAKYRLPIAIGKTINGEVYCADLAKMPHLLIAGSTGSGKSVGINTIIASLIYKIDPGKVKFVMIDPKKIELSVYRPLSEHYLAWRTDLDEEVITKPANAVSILNTMVLEMEDRYDKLAHLGVRNIDDYNDRVRTGGPRIKEEKLQQLPYIVVIIDELADLMMVAAKEVEAPIARLTQMARAVGIHLILATQRPSVDVITGVIKANFPARIAYMVTTRPDSKTILDMNGAEQLLGNGDMLYQPPGEPRPIRLQNPLITTEEVERIINHIRKQPKFPHYSLPQPSSSQGGTFNGFDGSGSDELYEDAKRIVVQHQQGSISLLQRRLKIGYSRAARLIDEMEEEGVVGPPDGSKPRQVFLQPEDL